MVPKTNGKIHSDASTRRRPESEEDGVQRSWADMDPELLFIIFMKLGVIDFISFSGVCRQWRKLSLRHREYFLNSKEPFVVTAPRGSKRACTLSNPFDGRKYKTMLPSFPGKIFAGLSCGYLIFFKRNPTTFFLFNLITRHELHFPPLPLDLTLSEFCAVVLFSPCISDYQLVVLDKTHKCIRSCQAGNDASKWNEFFFECSLLTFVDLHVFKGRLYFLHFDGRVGVMRLNPTQELKIFRVKSLPKSVWHFQQMFSSEEKLFVVSTYKECLLWELDFAKGEWVEGDYEKYAFFASRLKGSGTLDLDKWKGPKPERFSNTVFLIPVHCFHPGHAKIWYFPNTCYRTDVLDDSEQTWNLPSYPVIPYKSRVQRENSS